MRASRVVCSVIATIALATSAFADPGRNPPITSTIGALTSSPTTEPRAITLDAQLARALHVGTATAVPLIVDNRPGQPIRVTVPIEGVEYQLDLDPHSVRSPRYQVLVNRPDGSLVPVAAATECTLRGQIVGLPNTVVAGGILEEGLYATISMPDGTRWWLQPAENLSDDPMLKTSDLPPGPQTRIHALFRGTDPTEFAKCLNTETIDTTTTSATNTFADRGTSRRVAELAIDAEYAFYLKTGSVSRTQSILSTVINIVNIQYEREVDIRHQIGTIIVRQTQVYSIGEAGNPLLGQFRSRWNSNHASVSRDVAMLIDGNGNGGQSYMGTICDTSNAYAGVGMDWVNICYRTDTAAHELGHSWSACHCPCGDLASGNVYTMNWIITNANRFFGSPGSDCGPSSISQIATFRNSRSCLGTDTVGLGPPNDNCIDAVDLPCGVDDVQTICTFGFNNVWATTDGPVPPFGTGCTDSIASDIWFRFVPACDGIMTANTCLGTNFDTILAIYSGGCPLSGSIPVACSDDNGPACAGTASSVVFPVTRGTPYIIRIGGYLNSTGGGILTLTWSYTCTRPQSDRCVNAIPIVQGQPTAFSTRNALTGQWVQPGGPPRDSWLEPSCSGADDAQITNDIWYSFVAPCSGTARFSLCGSSFDTKMALYASCPTDNDTALICNDDSGPACATLQSSFDYPLLSGFNYIIRVGGYHGAVGEGVLEVNSVSCPPPANNACANAQVLASTSGLTFSAPAVQAGTDGSSTCGGFGADIWYSFVAPGAGTFTFSTCGTHDASNQDTVVSFHSACPGTTANQLGGSCNDTGAPSCGAADAGTQRDAFLTRELAAGEQVYIRVAVPFSGRFTAPVTINYSFFIPAPANDNCSGAIAWNGTHNFSTLGATPDGGDSCAGGSGPDVWYRYDAPLAGTAGITICNTSYSARLVVYANDSCSGGSTVVCRSSPSCLTAATFTTTPHGSYLICLSGNSQQTGTGTMTIAFVASTSGACCRGRTCTMTLPSACGTLSNPGIYQGNGTTCTVPVNACCHADINSDGRLTVQDIFDFLAAYFGRGAAGDFNDDGRPTVQDIFDFLAAYFTGC